MKAAHSLTPGRALKIGLGVAALAATTGVAFAAWAANSDNIVFSLVEAGLAWCF